MGNWPVNSHLLTLLCWEFCKSGSGSVFTACPNSFQLNSPLSQAHRPGRLHPKCLFIHFLLLKCEKLRVAHQLAAWGRSSSIRPVQTFWEPAVALPDTQGKQPKHISAHKSTFTCAQTSSFIQQITVRFWWTVLINCPLGPHRGWRHGRGVWRPGFKAWLRDGTQLQLWHAIELPSVVSSSVKHEDSSGRQEASSECTRDAFYGCEFSVVPLTLAARRCDCAGGT